MEKISRRNLFKFATAGSVAAGIGMVMKPETASPAAGAAPQEVEHSHGRGHHRQISGPHASATVSFGQWSTDPPLDRHRTNSPNHRNVHLLLPYEATIEAGGSVNFIISGAHQIGIYDNGTQFADINSSLVLVGSPEFGPGLINDPNRRIYRGLNPFDLFYDNALGVRDRVEVVQFPKPGRYLVVCLLVPHFADEMHGFVRVLP